MEQRQSGKYSWGIALLIAVLVCGLAFFGARLFKGLWGAPAHGEYIAVSLPGNAMIAVAGNGFIAYNGSHLSSISSRGDIEWTYMVGANASYDVGEAGVAVWSGKVLTILDRERGTATSSNPMSQDVLSAHTGAKYTAALLAPEHNSTLLVLENGGRQVDKIVFADQTVIDYGFFSNGALLWVMALDTNGTVPNCTISTYRPGRQIVGKIADAEQLMYRVMFQSSQVCAAGTTHLKVYDYTGAEIPAKRTLTYGYYLAAVDGVVDDPMMAFVPDAQYGGEATMHDVRMLKSDLDQIVRMPFGCTRLVAKGNRVYGFTADGKIMMAEAGRQAVVAFQTDVPAGEVYGVTDDRVAVIFAGGTAYLVTLP